jgi:hypothetical protein
MELGNQKGELHGAMYHKLFSKVYQEKQLIIDVTLSRNLWFKMNCDRYIQYLRINYEYR